ncbi:MAG: MFS transporter [Acidobacteria bacterium]|nr:MFS transporter [Acidobacteriota bacterium]
MPERLFTPRFFVMCGFSFTVFLSAFQLLPTAPFHIIDLGGSTFASGLFLGFLTYSSAFSAPLTGAYADRVGARRVLIVSSLALVVFSMLYAVITDVRVMLALVLVHGVFWSGLLSASAAYMTNLLPERRRAEGIGYWGLSTLAAVAVAPTVGFWIYNRGWLWLCILSAGLNLIMAVIATQLEEQPRAVAVAGARPRGLLERRVLIVSVTLALYSFGYGGITSFTALYADANGVVPKGIYLTTLAIVILLTRPVLGRLGDRWGYTTVFVPCLILIAVGLGVLALGGTRGYLLASAVIFGIGFGTAYPTYVGYVMRGVSADRRGAAFGAILAAFDTGIGTGSTSMGWLIQRYGFSTAFGVAAVLAILALPYFLAVDRVYTRE